MQRGKFPLLKKTHPSLLKIKKLHPFTIFLVLVLSACSILPGSYSNLPKTIILNTIPVDDENLQPSQTATTQEKQTPNSSTTEPNSTPFLKTTLSAVPLVSETLPPITETIPPPSTSDLLFLSQRQLLRWDPVTDFVGVLAEGVIDFSVSADGKTIAMLRSKDVTADGEEKYHLDLLDFETKQIKTLLEESPLLYYMKISPDAQWISFYDEEKPGKFYGIHIDNPMNLISADSTSLEPIQIGECESKVEEVTETAWSPDSKTLLWSDTSGIWILSPGEGKTRQIHNNRVNITNPQNQTSEIEVFFHSLHWSPTGRFAMVTVAPRSSNVSWTGVIDTRTDKLAQVPDSFEVNEWETSVSWMENGDLLVLHVNDPTTQSPPFLKVFRPYYTNPDLLVEAKRIDLPVDLFQEESVFSKTSLYLDWANQLDDRMSLLGVAQSGASIAPFLLRLDFDLNQFERIFDLPENTREILWSPDVQNALIIGRDQQILLMSLFDGSTRVLSGVLPEDAHDFFWLPPFPRS